MTKSTRDHLINEANERLAAMGHEQFVDLPHKPLYIYGSVFQSIGDSFQPIDTEGYRLQYGIEYLVITPSLMYEKQFQHAKIEGKTAHNWVVSRYPLNKALAQTNGLILLRKEAQ